MAGAAAVLAGASEAALPVAMGLRAGKRPAPVHSHCGLVLRPCLELSERQHAVHGVPYRVLQTITTSLRTCELESASAMPSVYIHRMTENACIFCS